MQFPIHTTETAPEAARQTLAAIQKNYGFLPNLAGAFATSPPVLSALLGLISAFDHAEMTLSALERQVVLLAASAKNGCEYCMSAHGMLAHKAGLSKEDVRRLQRGLPLPDGRLQALRQLVDDVVEQRGWVAPGKLHTFAAAGYTEAQVLEVVLGVALKTLTNYVNHIAKPPVNAEFAAYSPASLEATPA